MRKEHGFTLIELLIVLAILGILVGVVAMSVGGLNVTAKKRAMGGEYDIVLATIDTWLTQDVMVDESTAFTPTVGTPMQLDPDDTACGFTKYLKRKSKYYYTWGGLSATGSYTLTVQDANGTFSYDGTTWVVPS